MPDAAVVFAEPELPLPPESANPAGATKIAQVLRHRGYPVRVATGHSDLGYLDQRASGE